MLDINLEEHKTSDKKIIINSRIIKQEGNTYSTIKCYKSFPDIEILEAKNLNIIKIHKTIYLNLPNLILIDLRENTLCKISKNFKLFKNLETLHLDNNNITFIPLFIGELTNLKKLTISNNNLTSIPSSIQYLNSLETLKFSNNKVKKIPIEIGQLKKLECLYMDENYFSEIPTTLCYLHHLNEISLEWFEFLEPPLYKTLKDAFGKAFINIIKESLQELIKNSILYCNFTQFLEIIKKKKSILTSEKNAQGENNIEMTKIKKNENSTNNKYIKIKKAIEKNYYGIIKSLLEENDYIEYMNVKSNENKTSFYEIINTKNDDLISLFLSKIELSKYPLSHIYLHKAIRMRNPELVKKLILMGVNINATDDQGSSPFHILFSAFTKQLSECMLIGNFLLEKGSSINSFNNDNWAPIHIAARKAAKECLLWIIHSNKKLRKEGKEEFDLNLKGHNNWTPLHLTINSLRIEETIILLENGCDVFIRNADAKTPKKVSVGNYLFSKLLTNYENYVLEKKFKNDNQMFIKCFTSVDDDDEMYNSNNNIKNKVKKENLNNNQINFISNSVNYNNYKENNPIKNLKHENNEINNVIIGYNKKYGTSISYNHMNYNNNNINSSQKKINHKILSSSERNYETSKVTNKTQESPLKAAENLNCLKDILINNESPVLDKYESLTYIKLSKYDIKLLIKIIIDCLDLDIDINLILITDICNCIISCVMIDLIPNLKQISNNTLLKEKKNYIKNEIDNTILVLENLKNNSNLIQYQNNLFINQEKIEEKKIKDNIKKIGFDDNEMFYNSNGESEEIEENENNNFEDLIKENEKK